MSIDDIGEKIVSCRLKCEGIRNEEENYIIPRCFYFEDPDNLGKPDCIIIGTNPGHASPEEIDYYKNHGISYKTVKDFFRNEMNEQGYYKLLRDFAKEIGFGKAILWTELCKCESLDKKHPPFKTLRTCIKKFLRDELEQFPGVPIIAAGKTAFEILGYMCFDRAVIGVPHPSPRNRKNFNSLFENGKLKDEYRKKISLEKGDISDLFPKIDLRKRDLND